MKLKDFIENKMRLSHIYQPLMIKILLERGGTASKSDIAKSFLSKDNSQIEYYTTVTTRMPGKVLAKHGIVNRNKDTYHLNDIDGLSENEIQELIDICDNKINQYIVQRGEAIWSHRDQRRKPVSGSVRYNVLKAAKGRCELCGVSKDARALDVDHIIPKSTGGSDDLTNYQALCWKCNSNKGNRDDEDFRDLTNRYNNKVSDCIFCNLEVNDLVAFNQFAIAYRDKYPIVPMHTLIIPKRHCKDVFELDSHELKAMHDLSKKIKDQDQEQDPSIKGFNIGYNSGEVAGQTIFHCHMHLIPRRIGDVSHPIGGVRNIIAGKGSY